MIKVLQPFYDGNTFTLYETGMEIADDPSLAWAEQRGLVKRIEVKAKAEKKPAAKKPVTKKK